MKLTRTALYGLKAAAHLAGQGGGRLVPSHEIARAALLPEGFLLRVLELLVRAGVLASVPGPHGGYRLARPAREITVLEVIEATQGPVRGQVPPPSRKDPGSEDSRLEALCQEVADDARRLLQQVKVADLMAKSRKGSKGDS